MVDNIKTVGADSISALLDAKTNVESKRAEIDSKQRAEIDSAPTGYKYNRYSLRLKHYDYSCTGYYFITICTQNREHLFGEIVDGVMGLNVAGEMVHTLWYAMKEDFPNIALHEFIIMPNHIHCIIEIVGKNIQPVGADSISAREPMYNVEPTNEMQSHNL